MPHQCMHHYEADGRRCRGRAMHNEFMCYAHRDKTVPPVIENNPFEITALDSRTAIQQALADVAARLAANQIDLRRAGLLAYTLQVASANLGFISPAPPTANQPTPSPDPSAPHPPQDFPSQP